jgi:hypothetical protein
MVEILNYIPVENKNKLIGLIDVKVQIVKPTTLLFRNLAHLSDGSKRWINLPTFVRELEGMKKFLKYCEFETGDFNSHLLMSTGKGLGEFMKRHQIPERQVAQTRIDENETLPF